MLSQEKGKKTQDLEKEKEKEKQRCAYIRKIIFLKVELEDSERQRKEEIRGKHGIKCGKKKEQRRERIDSEGKREGKVSRIGRGRRRGESRSLITD